jgi:hypothetical protein
MFFATGTIFSDTESIFSVPDTTFFATHKIFSVAQKTAGEAPAEKRNKQEALITILRKLKHYVEDNCGNDAAVLLSSGYSDWSNPVSRMAT